MTTNLPTEKSSVVDGTVFALLLNKSAIGIYTSYERAHDAWKIFQCEGGSASKEYLVKPFKLDGPARIYLPY